MERDWYYPASVLRGLSAALTGMVVLLFVAASAQAWGTRGHRLICQIAWDKTTDAGRTFAGQVLGVSDAAGFADTCNWADVVRELAEYKWSKPHHFHEPPQNEELDVNKHCPDKGCAGRAIGQQARIAADTAELPLRRAQALKFVAHFVGDIHQPLHAGYTDDLGGNTIDVEFCAAGCLPSVSNLHKVWDSGIIALSGSDEQLIEDLQGALPLGEANDSVTTWVEQSHAAAADFAYRQVTKKGKIKPGYIGDLSEPVAIKTGYLVPMRPIVMQQLQRAAVRLAKVLEVLATGSAPATLTTVAPRFVEPAADVSSFITVSAKADSASTSVAQLPVGKRAELLGEEKLQNKPQFRRVRLEDGKQGYVLKKKTRVVE